MSAWHLEKSNDDDDRAVILSTQQVSDDQV